MKKENGSRKRLTEAEKRQRSRYQVSFKLNPKADADIIKVLDQVDKKQTFIKDCIRHFDKVWKKAL